MFSVRADQVSEIARQLHDCGVMRLGGAISPSWVTTARDEIGAYVERHGHGDHDLLNLDDWECPAIRRFAESPAMESLLKTLVTRSTAQGEVPLTYTRRVLRIHDGTGGVTSKPHVWHYDGNAVTVIVPIVTPGGDSGHFGTIPVYRSKRRNLLNVVQEIVRIGRYPFPRARRKFNKSPDRYTNPLIVGEALFFVGHRTLHSALPWPVGTLRANVVLHFGHLTEPESGPLRASRALRDRLASLQTRSLPPRLRLSALDTTRE